MASLSNYRGTALASSFSKLLEYCILEDFGSCLLSCHLKFGFKPGLSTTLCTGVLKTTISRYLAGGSCVYGCLVDASNHIATDTINRVRGSLFPTTATSHFLPKMPRLAMRESISQISTPQLILNFILRPATRFLSDARGTVASAQETKQQNKSRQKVERY